MTQPPRLATWLLSRQLDPSERDEVLGDLDEDFVHQAHVRGRAAAVRWYWRHVLLLPWQIKRESRDPRPRRRLIPADEVRYAVRRLLRQPAVAIGSIATMTGAIGAAVATWTLISAILLHPLPVRDPARLVAVAGRYPVSFTNTADGPLVYTFFYPTLTAVQTSHVFADVAGAGQWAEDTVFRGSRAKRQALFISPSFFEVLGLPLQAGRAFVPSDDERGAPLVAILSDALWRAAFGSNRDAIGQHLSVQGVSATIVGVAPARFRGLELSSAPDLYLPLNTIAEVAPPQINWFSEPLPTKFPMRWVRIIGRLEPHDTPEQATSRLSALRAHDGSDPSGLPGQRGSSVFGGTLKSVRAVGIEAAVLGETSRGDAKRFTQLLGVAVGLLLTIGCLAVGMLLFVRAQARRDELSLCVALGASRGRLVAGIVTEAAALAAVSGLLGVPLSTWLVACLRTFQLPGTVQVSLLQIHVQTETVIASALLVLFATFLLGLAAGGVALSATGIDALRHGTGSAPRSGGRRVRQVLVIAHVAVALVLLAGAGLFGRSLAAALSLNPGYDTSHLLTAMITVGPAPGSLADRDFPDLRERLVHDRTIRAASFAVVRGVGADSMAIDGQVRPVPGNSWVYGVDETYFPTLGLPIVRGRNFVPTDQHAAQVVGIVSRSLAAVITPGANAVGHRVKLFSQMGRPPYDVEIVGVVPDLVTEVGAVKPPHLYVPASLDTEYYPGRIVVVRAATDADAAARATRAIITASNPAAVPTAFETLDTQLLQQMGPQRLGATVMGALGTVAAVLTLLALLVLVESIAVLRRREWGIRLALGATPPQVGAFILQEIGLSVAIGVTAGLALVWLGAGLIRVFLYHVAPVDLPTIGAVIGMFAMMALGVSARPAMRAGRIDVARILREN